MYVNLTTLQSSLLKQQSVRIHRRSSQTYYQSSLLLFSTAHLAEIKKNANFIGFNLTRTGLEFMLFRIRGEHGNPYATDAVFPL